MKNIWVALGLLVSSPWAVAGIKLQNQVKGNLPSSYIINLEGADAETSADQVADYVSQMLAKQTGEESVNVRVVKSSLNDSIALLEKPHPKYTPMGSSDIQKIKSYNDKNSATPFIVHLRSLSMAGGGLTLYHVYVNQNKKQALAVEQSLYAE